MSTQILVMRHAEKPVDASNPDLSPEGVVRAEALASYIPAKFGGPRHIFAASISRHSARPYETVKPLSKAAGVAIDATYADQDYGALAQLLLGGGKFADALTVVCWHHGNIPNLLNALGARSGDYPDPWGRDVFNLILKIEIGNGEAIAVTSVTEPF